MAKKLPPEEAVQRRLQLYPQEMWMILEALQRKVGWTKEFQTHHGATSFVARYNRFKGDAITGVPGAQVLTNVSVTGKDANGMLFATKRQGQAPYLLQWELNELPFEVEEELKKIQVYPTAPEGPKVRKTVGEDEHDAVIRRVMGLPDECKHEADATGTRCLLCNRPMPEEPKS